MTLDEFDALIDSEDANAIYGSRILFTVLAGGDYVEDTLERARALVNVQLPQKFDRAQLKGAHDQAIAEGRSDFTEDASLVYDYLKTPIRILEGRTTTSRSTELIDPDHRRGHLQRVHKREGAGLMKTATITGASQGIGRAAAVRLSASSSESRAHCA